MGRNFAPMAPANSSSVESRSWLPCRAPRGIAYPQPAMSAGATKTEVIWFVDEDEVVKRILEVVCRDEIAVAITYQEAKEHDTFKEGRATKRRRKDGPFSKTQSSST